MEVLAAGADKAHAHIEAGNEEDTRQQDAAHGAEQQDKQQINQKKSAASVLSQAVREHPDISQSHCGTDAGEHKSQRIAEASVFVIHSKLPPKYPYVTLMYQSFNALSNIKVL